MFAYQRVRNVSFSENFAYVPNEWSLSVFPKSDMWSHDKTVEVVTSIMQIPIDLPTLKWYN